MTNVLPDISGPSRADQISAVCKRFDVEWLAMFGSTARGEQRPDSDVDLLAKFATSARPTLYTIFDLSEALSPLFDGREIDLGTPDSLHWFIRDEVLKSAKVLYVA